LKTCGNGEAYTLPVTAKCFRSLHITARKHQDLRNHRWRSGQALRFAPLLLCLYAQGSRWTDPDDRTNLRRFKGIPVSRGFIDFPLRSTSNGLASPPMLQPTGFPHLPHSQEGYGVVIDAEVSKYLYSLGPSKRIPTDYIWAFRAARLSF
jgi:hypothetical protein